MYNHLPGKPGTHQAQASEQKGEEQV